MGIEKTVQLHMHPLYGAIFETAVVTELRKRLLNSGDLPRLYYWRDNAKLEIDLIREETDGTHLIEIKSGRTYRSEWSKPMRRWLSATEFDPCMAEIIYAGKTTLMSNGIKTVPWFEA